MHSFQKKPLLSFSSPSLSIILLSSLLSACGGATGENIDSNHSSEPIQIGGANWKLKTANRLSSNATVKAKIIRTKKGTRTNPKFVPSRFQIRVEGISQAPSHYQVHIDIDNDPTTGFQFDNEVWSQKSGIDYIIQGNQLYKSTANDSSWSWKWVKSLATNQNGSTKTIDIDIKGSALNQFSPLCDQLNIGYVEFDNRWNITDFYPRATSPLHQSISFCSHSYNTPPKITLNGNGNMIVELDDPTYSDPGASAYDDQDGDISSKIQITTNVNIHQTGTYTVNYKVSDSKGSIDTIGRNVVVVNPSQKGISIDGKYNDWSSVNPLVSKADVTRSGNFTTRRSYLLNATDDRKNLYLYADAHLSFPAQPDVGGSRIEKHWQIFLDTDNNSTTGYEGGFDYMVEDGDLYEFFGTKINRWAWKNIPSNLNSARGFSSRSPNRGSVEIAISKSKLRKLRGNTINIRFSALDDNWMEAFSMPLTQTSSTYRLKH